MKSLTTLLLLATTTCLGQPTKTPPSVAVAPLKSTLLLTANVTAGGPIVIGPGPAGDRIAYPLTGGTFWGPRLNGTVLPVGADFSILRADNQFSPDGISILQTSDGANILFKDTGYQSGEYVYGSVTFETGDKRYAWLNSVVAVSRALVDTGSSSAAVGMDIFVVSIFFAYGMVTIGIEELIRY
jgi:hypothetical protein